MIWRGFRPRPAFPKEASMMIRTGVILAAALLAGTTSRGGELDREYGGKFPTTVGPARAALSPSMAGPGLGAARAGELDGELPAQSYRHGHFGYGGFGRFGYGGFGGGYGGFGGYRGFGGFGYPGFGFGGYRGYGYRSIGIGLGGFGSPFGLGFGGFGYPGFGGGFGYPGFGGGYGGFGGGYGGFGGGYGGFGGFGGGYGGYGGGYGLAYSPVGYGFGGGCW
jgi:hypothetical protein